MLLSGQFAKPRAINYVVFLLFAGHGILKDGMQHLVLNEFDEQTGFYKLFNAEDYVRRLSTAFCLNSYFICLFACCRELYDPDTMTKNFEG